MANLGWHVIHDGQKLFRKTKAAAVRLAQQLADDSGRQVQVRELDSRRIRAASNPAAGGDRPEFVAGVADKVREAGYRMTPAAWRHLAFMARERRVSQVGAANLIIRYLAEGHYKGSPYALPPIKAKRNPAPTVVASLHRIKARRNPALAGVDYTGEQWTVAGVGPRGRIATTEGTRRDAELMAEYLFRQGYRALTIRRTAKGAAPTAGAKRPTIDTRPGSARRRRA